MSLFKKPKKHIQRRVFGSNADDEGNEHNGIDIEEDEKVEMQTSQKNKKKDRKDRTQTKQTLLSFGDEDEGEVFQVKKSSHSKKIMRLLDKERRKKKEDKIETEEIKPKTDEKRTEIVTGDLVMVVKNSETTKILNGRAALCAGRDDISSEEDEGPTAHKFSQPESVKIVLESGKIPDAAMIHAARKRRQRARELGDYVPLDDSQTGSVPEKDRGRLVREDQDDSDEERIDMSVNLTARDRDKRREQFFAAQDEESEPDTDKEMEEWENQQIRKGVTGAQIMAVNQESNFTQYVTAPIVKVEYTSSTIPLNLEPGAPRTPHAIADKLRQRLLAVRESRERHSVDLLRVSTELGDTATELQQLEVRAPRAAQRFRFYQELRGYVTDLVECLDEKVPVIIALEQRALDLLGRRSERLAERRRQDVRDQAEEVALAVRPGMRRSGLEEEARVRRAAEREGRRARRRRSRETLNTTTHISTGVPKHIEGMSSDDEEPDQDTVTFQAQKEQILTDVQAVFDDVVEDFSSVTAILDHFARWRTTDLSAYTEAYASLCLPRVISPLLRLALVFWHPLNDDVDVDKCAWYSTLMLYGAQSFETEDSLANDPDLQLVPIVIEKIVVPKLVHLVERCWDPMSSSQTLRLVGLLGRYVRRYPSLSPTSKSLHMLFNAILDKLKSAVEHDVFIPIFPKQMLESKSPFFQRQFSSGLKLLRNVTSWQGIINDQMLKDLALGALLNRYLLSGLRVCQITDAVSKAGLISHILPRIWLQSDTQQLQMFSSFVSQLAAQLDKDNPLHLESVEVVAGILKSLRCT